MEYKLAQGGLKVPAIGMGTWGMGGRMEKDATNSGESITALREGLKLGFRHIDTAEIYGAGLSEEIVGKAISGLPRNSIVITSKFWRHSKKKDILRSVKSSLMRLGVDSLDFCLAHRPPEDNGYCELADALKEIVKKELAFHIGVSNFSLVQIEKLKNILGNVRIDAIQTEYNILNQSARAEYFEYCRKNNILIMAHRPLAKGLLGEASDGFLEGIASRYSKSVPQLALRWLIQQEGVVAIPKSSSTAHLQENLGALGWAISEEDMHTLSNYRSAQQ